MGLSAPEVRAGNLTLTLAWFGGTTGRIAWTIQFAQAGSTSNSLTIDTGILNGFLLGTFTGISFDDLGASSNNNGFDHPGDPAGSVLRETGTGFLNAFAGTRTISIVASQDSFMTPSGAGKLTSSSTANFTSTLVGSQSSSGSLDGTSTATLVFAPPGGFSTNSTGAFGNPSGYTLTASSVIDLTGGSTGASDQMTNKVTFGPSVVPEPASLVMMLTGMPLSLMALGLIRRRRAAG